MKGVVVVDTNLLVLLVVGSARRDYISKHKRLKDHYNVEDFELLVSLIAEFSDIVLLPHILTEVSNLSRNIDNPAKKEVQEALRTLIETSNELPLLSSYGSQRPEFHELGLTDAVILHLCSMSISGINPTLITTDTDLANNANSLGFSVIDYKEEYQAG